MSPTGRLLDVSRRVIFDHALGVDEEHCADCGDLWPCEARLRARAARQEVRRD